MVYKFLDKKSTGTFTHTGTGINFKNQQLAQELHKPVIKKFNKRKVYLSFKDHMADRQLISKYNKEIRIHSLFL